MNAWETATHLVPPGLHKQRALQSDFSFLERLRLPLAEVRVVYLHQILPVDMRNELPQLTSAWAQLAAAKAPGQRAGTGEKWQRELFRSDRGANVERFIESITRSRHPTLHFLHTMLPHTPWLYLSSGKLHDAAREAPEQRERNTEDVRIAFQEGPDIRLALQQQKHLLQTAYVDTLLGKLLDHLEQEGIFDETLLVVTADHGRSFMRGKRRVPTPRSYAGTMFVPLLIKLPRQRKGIVSDVNAQNVDIVPSIADALGAPVEWKLDGRSLFADGPRPAAKHLFSYGTRRTDYPMKPAVEHLHALLARNVKRFDLDAPDHDLYRFGLHRQEIGRPSPAVVGDEAPLAVEYEWGASVLAVDPDSGIPPTHIVGWVDAASFDHVAISIDGVVGAVPRLTTREGRQRLEAFLPEHAAAGAERPRGLPDPESRASSGACRGSSIEVSCRAAVRGPGPPRPSHSSASQDGTRATAQTPRPPSSTP